MYFKELNKFLVLWISQSFSSFGSSMTGFAIAIWAYTETGSALVLSVSGVAIMLPKMIGGIFSGPIVDKLNKKVIIIVADIGAGLCTFLLFLLLKNDALQIWHIYVLNIISSLFGCFQTPASDVVFSMIIPKKSYTKASALQSVSGGIVQVFSPAFAALLLSLVGIAGVIFFDLITLSVACITLMLFLKLPPANKSKKTTQKTSGYFSDLLKGIRVLYNQKLLITMLFFLVFINLIAGMTYYNLLTPMILARTQNDSNILAWVNAALGASGIVGGIVAVFLPSPERKVRVVFLCATFSFLFGDILLAMGKTPFVWVCAAFLSSFFLPFLNANENYLWRTSIPIDFQGRVFAFKYAMQSGSVPIGMLAGGILADYVFEPYMMSADNIFSALLGNSAGSGMALMFFFTGIFGVLISLLGLTSKHLAGLENKLHYKN